MINVWNMSPPARIAVSLVSAPFVLIVSALLIVAASADAAWDEAKAVVHDLPLGDLWRAITTWRA